MEYPKDQSSPLLYTFLPKMNAPNNDDNIIITARYKLVVCDKRPFSISGLILYIDAVKKEIPPNIMIRGNMLNMLEILIALDASNSIPPTNKLLAMSIPLNKELVKLFKSENWMIAMISPTKTPEPTIPLDTFSNNPIFNIL